MLQCVLQCVSQCVSQCELQCVLQCELQCVLQCVLQCAAVCWGKLKCSFIPNPPFHAHLHHRHGNSRLSTELLICWSKKKSSCFDLRYIRYILGKVAQLFLKATQLFLQCRLPFPQNVPFLFPRTHRIFLERWAQLFLECAVGKGRVSPIIYRSSGWPVGCNFLAHWDLTEITETSHWDLT